MYRYVAEAMKEFDSAAEALLRYVDAAENPRMLYALVREYLVAPSEAEIREVCRGFAAGLAEYAGNRAEVEMVGEDGVRKPVELQVAAINPEPCRILFPKALIPLADDPYGTFYHDCLGASRKQSRAGFGMLELELTPTGDAMGRPKATVRFCTEMSRRRMHPMLPILHCGGLDSLAEALQDRFGMCREMILARVRGLLCLHYRQVMADGIPAELLGVPASEVRLRFRGHARAGAADGRFADALEVEVTEELRELLPAFYRDFPLGMTDTAGLDRLDRLVGRWMTPFGEPKDAVERRVQLRRYVLAVYDRASDLERRSAAAGHPNVYLQRSADGRYVRFNTGLTGVSGAPVLACCLPHRAVPESVANGFCSGFRGSRIVTDALERSDSFAEVPEDGDGAQYPVCDWVAYASAGEGVRAAETDPFALLPLSPLRPEDLVYPHTTAVDYGWLAYGVDFSVLPEGVGETACCRQVACRDLLAAIHEVSEVVRPCPSFTWSAIRNGKEVLLLPIRLGDALVPNAWLELTPAPADAGNEQLPLRCRVTALLSEAEVGRECLLVEYPQNPERVWAATYGRFAERHLVMEEIRPKACFPWTRTDAGIGIDSLSRFCRDRRPPEPMPYAELERIHGAVNVL